jgi:hypothetical protein
LLCTDQNINQRWRKRRAEKDPTWCMCPETPLSLSLSLFLSFSLSIFLSCYLSIFLSFFLSIFLSFYLSIFLSCLKLASLSFCFQVCL